MVAEPKEATDTTYYFMKANVKLISGSISMILKDYNHCKHRQADFINSNFYLFDRIEQTNTKFFGCAWRNQCWRLHDQSRRVGERAANMPGQRGKEDLASDYVNNGYGTVPLELRGSFQIIFYQSAEDAAFKVLGVE